MRLVTGFSNVAACVQGVFLSLYRFQIKGIFASKQKSLKPDILLAGKEYEFTWSRYYRHNLHKKYYLTAGYVSCILLCKTQ